MRPVKGQRKTQDPCLGCYLHRSLCICDLIPRLELKTRVALIVHAKELKRTTNTGRLAIKALVNSEMRVRGESNSKTALDLSDLLSAEYQSFLFYPSEDAVELTFDLVAATALPIQLIVPDGNWRQASKVHIRHTELANVPRVMISTPNSANLHLRAESTLEGMATLQAIATAIGLTERDGGRAGLALQELYQLKLERTLQGRGVLPKEKAKEKAKEKGRA
jgi:DTW domain-containing protein